MLVWNNKTPLNNNYETLFILYLFYLLWYLCFNLINMFAIIALTFFRVQTQHSLADVFSNSSVLLYQQKRRDCCLCISHILPVERAVRLKTELSQYSRSPVSGAILNRLRNTSVHSVRFTPRLLVHPNSLMLYMCCSCHRISNAVTWLWLDENPFISVVSLFRAFNPLNSPSFIMYQSYLSLSVFFAKRACRGDILTHWQWGNWF